MTHTPGPWTHTKLGNNADQWGVYQDADKTGGYVVLAAQGEANARLIAAAPELLRALEEAAVYLEACAEEQRYDAGADDAGALAEQARAAIAAALGKEKP